MRLRVPLALLFVGFSLAAQHKVDSRQAGHRIYVVCPMIGDGSQQNPFRPKYAPLPSELASPSRSGIKAFHYVESDDGRFALVEFAAWDRAAFRALLQDRSIQVFHRGMSRRDDVESEFRKYRKDFDLSAFGSVALR